MNEKNEYGKRIYNASEHTITNVNEYAICTWTIKKVTEYVI